MVAELKREHWRTAGCGPECGRYFVRLPGTQFADWLDCHDPDRHEAYGRLSTTRAYAAEAYHETVETGVLLLDGELARVLVAGREVRLTPTEWAVLAYLGSKLGRLVSRRELIQAVWGPEYATEGVGLNLRGVADAHLLRVTMARLRGKLGPARGLIVTVSGVGYRLDRVPPERAP